MDDFNAATAPENYGVEGDFSAAPGTRLHDYFGDLRAPGLDTDEFQNNWINLEDCARRDTIYNALYKTARTLKFLPPSKQETLYGFLYGPGGVHAWQENYRDFLDVASPRELAGVMWSMGELDYLPAQSFLFDWRAQVQENLDDFCHHDLADIVRGFSNIGLYPGDDFTKKLLHRVTDIAEDFNAYRFSTLLHGLARIAAKPNKAFLTTCMDVADRIFTDDAQYTNMDMRMYLWAMCVLSVTGGVALPRDRFTPMIDGLKLDNEYRFNSTLLKQVCAYLNVECDYPDRVQSETVSIWEKSLRKEFKKVAGFVYDENAGVPKGLQHIPDIVGEYRGKKIVIEADGPPHFIQMLDGGKQFDGSTRLQTVLLTRALPDARILRLNYDDVNDTNPRLQKLLNALASNKPGAYKSKQNAGGRPTIMPFFARNVPNPI